jgi:hypothetical protein
MAFAFMAGEYPAYLAAHPGAAPGCPAAGFASGPRGLALWVGSWTPCYRFEQGFLVLWGARCAPPPAGSRLVSVVLGSWQQRAKLPGSAPRVCSAS